MSHNTSDALPDWFGGLGPLGGAYAGYRRGEASGAPGEGALRGALGSIGGGLLGGGVGSVLGMPGLIGGGVVGSTLGAHLATHGMKREMLRRAKEAGVEEALTSCKVAHLFTPVHE